MSARINIAFPTGAIAAFCKRHHIRKLSLFGSILRDDFSAESDIDVLIEFEPGTVVGWKIVAMREELKNLLNREVDLLTPNSLSLAFRDEVLEQAQVIYEQT